MIYLELLLVALVIVYIVDISGFTESWRSGLARMLNIAHLRPLPPFDCGKCMAWWSCLLYALLIGEFNLFTVAFSAAMSLLSVPIGNALIFIRESMTWMINKIMP